MKINADMNAKNWLTKKYVLKDLTGILATVNVNMIKHVLLENIRLQNCKCGKRLVENIDENELHPTELQPNKMIYNLTLNDYLKNI